MLRVASSRRAAVCFESMEARRLFAADLVSDAAGLYPTDSVMAGGLAYFFANDGVNGRELWRSDGTAAGTKLVKDLTPGADGTQLHGIFYAGGRAVFITSQSGPQGSHGANYTLWSSDGTAGGTIKLAEFASSFVTARQVGDRVAFFVSRRSAAGESMTDSDLYFTDGTVGGTTLVKRFVAFPESPGVRSFDYAIDSMHVAGSRIVFGIGSEWIWASDGTAAGTIDLTPIVGYNGRIVFATSLYHMEEFEGKVLIPTEQRKLWVTDGTAAGTSGIAFDVPRLETSRIVGHTYFFQTQGVEEDGRTFVRTLYALDLETGDITALYSPPGDDVMKHFSLNAAGGKLLFSISNGATGDIEMWSSDGTPGGTSRFAAFSAIGGHFLSGVAVGDQLYFPFRGPAALELWRSDGTPEGTGIVRTLWSGPNVFQPGVTLSEVAGKLAVQLQGSINETVVYDPVELNLGRSGATARIVNGVLRLGGSLGNDTFRLYRRASNPNELIVEYNGNVRSFAFSSIRRIVADLQDGNDRFEIVETGGAIRTRTSVMGGDGADTIITGTGQDTIIGGNGGDLIRARGNADLIDGNGGRDRINAGAGDDRIGGGTNYDQVVSGAGNDVLFGQTAIEMAFGRDLEGEDLLGDVLLLAE